MSGLSLLTAAREVPDRPAVIVDGSIYTYASLADRVERLLPLFSRIRPSSTPSNQTVEALGAPCVALLGNTRLESLILLYALLELGIPTVLVHPRLSQVEQREMVELYRPEIYFDDPAIDEAIRQTGSASGSVTVPRIPDERCLALVRTSGSSGRSKGVVLSRRAFEASARASAERLGWQSEDRWLLSLPLAHVGGLSILTRCLIARRTVVIPAWSSFRVDPAWQTLVEDRITLLSLVPTMLRRLLIRGAPPKSLRALLLGGAASSPALLNQAADLGWPVLTTYGLTESCSQVTLQLPGTVHREQLGSGPALAGTTIRLREQGRIEIHGPTLMSGYFPAASESPWSEDGWLRTGDHGRLDAAGHLHVLGRLDDVIVSGGENVAPLEVEQALEAHPAIAEAVVFGIEDEEWGQAVATAVVWNSLEEDKEAMLLDDLRQRLASFARPRWLASLQELPRNPTGKLDRRRAAEKARPFLKRLG